MYELFVPNSPGNAYSGTPAIALDSRSSILTPNEFAGLKLLSIRQTAQLATLEQMFRHYNMAPARHSELQPLDLIDEQLEQIIAFLHTLDSPVNAWLKS